MQSLEAYLTAVAIPAGPLILRGPLRASARAYGLGLFGFVGQSSRQNRCGETAAETSPLAGPGSVFRRFRPEMAEGANGAQHRLMEFRVSDTGAPLAARWLGGHWRKGASVIG
jgi:hypothetical protein